MIRKLVLAAALAVGGLAVAAAPAQATGYTVIYTGSHATLAECEAAGQQGLADGWGDYRCQYYGSAYSLLRIEYHH